MFLKVKFTVLIKERAIILHHVNSTIGNETTGTETAMP